MVHYSDAHFNICQHREDKMKLDRIEVVTEYKHLHIREITDDGGFHRRVLKSDQDVSGEVQTIQDTAEAEWTDEVKSAWITHLEEQESKKLVEN